MQTLFDKILEADAGLRPQVPVSSLEFSAKLSHALGCQVWNKTDHLQPTGSFKVRGSANKIRVLGDLARARGVVTASTGNHGLGVARASKLAGVAATVYIGHGAMPAKVQAIRDLGAEIVEVDGSPLAAELEARRQSELTGKPYVAPYNDYDTIAGQGTIGAELARQHKDLDAVFVCVGGGGLVAGIGVAMKQLSPKTRIIGVSPENSRCMLESLKAGRIIAFEEFPTLSDASLGEVEPGSVTFPLCQQVIDHTIVVDEREIAGAMRMVAQSDGWMVEGTAGVALAGLMQQRESFRGQNVAIVLCGRNVTVDTFMGAMALAGPTELETAAP